MLFDNTRKKKPLLNIGWIKSLKFINLSFASLQSPESSFFILQFDRRWVRIRQVSLKLLQFIIGQLSKINFV